METLIVIDLGQKLTLGRDGIAGRVAADECGRAHRRPRFFQRGKHLIHLPALRNRDQKCCAVEARVRRKAVALVLFLGPRCVGMLRWVDGRVQTAGDGR